MKNGVGVIVVVGGLVVLGQYNAKVALMLSGAVFLGAVLYNGERAKAVLRGGE